MFRNHCESHFGGFSLVEFLNYFRYLIQSCSGYSNQATTTCVVFFWFYCCRPPLEQLVNHADFVHLSPHTLTGMEVSILTFPAWNGDVPYRCWFSVAPNPLEQVHRSCHHTGKIRHRNPNLATPWIRLCFNSECDPENWEVLRKLIETRFTVVGKFSDARKPLGERKKDMTWKCTFSGDGFIQPL
jgi:hypothetical protein